MFRMSTKYNHQKKRSYVDISTCDHRQPDDLYKSRSFKLLLLKLHLNSNSVTIANIMIKLLELWHSLNNDLKNVNSKTNYELPSYFIGIKYIKMNTIFKSYMIGVCHRTKITKKSVCYHQQTCSFERVLVRIPVPSCCLEYLAFIPACVYKTVSDDSSIK